MSELVYLTGGTSGQPRMVAYAPKMYRQSVEITRQILAAHGVSTATRVAICHPFDPWAIGGVFRDAALACHAKVLPMGLSAMDESLWSTFIAFSPLVLCGSASLLTRLAQRRLRSELPASHAKRLIFHAGEPLTEAARSACSELWDAKVIDVYGSADFDSIASEGISRPGLILSPHLECRIRPVGRERPLPLERGLEGELLLRRSGDTAWRKMSDRIRVLDRSSNKDGLWPNSWLFQHLGRTDISLQLPDGTLIRASSIVALARTLSIDQIQIHNYRSQFTTMLRVLVSNQGAPKNIPAETIRRTLLRECFELADAVKHGVAVVRVRIVDSSRLTRTSRGKVMPFVEH